MCGPMAALGLGMSAAGSIMNYSSEQAKAKQNNTKVLQNAQNASLAASRQYEDEQRKYIYDAKQIQQEGYQAALKGAAAQGTIKASAGSSGFDAASVTLGGLLGDVAGKTAQNLANIKMKQDDQEDAYDARVDTAHAQAVSRTNSMSMVAGPSPLALGLNIANSAVGSMKGMM